MRDLYLLNYNNYNNRIVKREVGLLSYENYLCADIARGVNFVPGNGINTKVTINSKYIDLSGVVPDYLLVVEEGIIESRWFVMNVVRTANGQHKLDLKRDSIADNLNVLMDNSSVYNVQRGWVKDTDPAIFNSEGFSFNQIKKEEVLLKDYTEVPWIVGYISPDVAKDRGDVVANIEGYYDSDYTNLEQYPYYKYVGKKIGAQDDLGAKVKKIGYDYDVNDNTYAIADLYLWLTGSNLREVITCPDRLQSLDVSCDAGRYLSDIESIGKTGWAPGVYINQNMVNSMSLTATQSGYDMLDSKTMTEFLNQDGRIFKVGTDKYKATVVRTEKANIGSINVGTYIDRVIQGGVLKKDVTITDNYLNKVYPDQVFGPGFMDLVIKGGYELKVEKIGLVEDKTAKFTYSFKGKDVSNPETPYGIICMPYVDGWKIGNETLGLSKEARLKMFQALGSIQGLLYDIQLLPYCPLRNLVIDKTNKTIQLNNAITSIEVKVGELSPTYATAFLVAKKANQSFYIYAGLKKGNRKIQNETEMYRLCSPNYSGVFEFNVAKFDGDVNTFKVDLCFKPYSPYIHVAPAWSGLYGKDFNDARGLICGGDWSIDRISDNWETYQYNNKNFQLQFDRQIETMELQSKWAQRSALVQGSVNAVTTGISGGIMGSMAGPVGMAAGAGLGALTGVFDAAYNYSEQKALNTDAINAAKDQFRFNLENIQAQPYGLTKVSALNSNNKLFPFIERYSCTDEEVKYLQDYIDEQGMTVGRVGHLLDYYKEGGFIVAGLIKAPMFKGSAMMLTDIIKELLEGVHLYAD